jgi:hypothetical protein
MTAFTNMKDPDETLDFGLDLTDWLEDGDAISSASWTVPTGMTEVSESTSSPTTAVMTSGGTAGTTYRLKGTVTTTDGRVLVRRIAVHCAER